MTVCKTMSQNEDVLEDVTVTVGNEAGKYSIKGCMFCMCAFFIQSV
jgi:hypothetical protein